VILTYKAARAYKEIANLCPFYTTRKILPEELNFTQYLNKKSIQLLSSQIETQNDRKKKLQNVHRNYQRTELLTCIVFARLPFRKMGDPTKLLYFFIMPVRHKFK
jgi:hypothetical protein